MTSRRVSPGVSSRRVSPGVSSRRVGTVTSRAAILGVVVSLLAVLVAVPLRTYLAQHATIVATARDQAAQRHRIDLLKEQIAHDNDPAVIEQQARLRLQLVLPGEKDYVVIPTPAKKAPPPPKDRPTALVPAGVTTQTWFGALWSSTQAAGTTAPAAGTTAPAATHK